MASEPSLRLATRLWILVAACLSLVFDGVELGLMPVASLSVSKSLLGDAFTPTLGGEWFARFTAALLFGAAVGGILLGNLGDRIGRQRALGISILFYSVFAGLGSFAQTQEQMLVLRFLVGLGVGGVWPNSITLAIECWPKVSRPWISGVMSAGLNAGILLVSQLARLWPITPDSWHWAFQLAGLPALLGLIVFFTIPESPAWLALRHESTLSKASSLPRVRISDLFARDLLRITLIGIVISSIPMIGAWAASKWMIPWSDSVAGTANTSYKAATQGWWALGATLGCLAGPQFASWLGRRTSYFLTSIGATLLTIAMFQATAPLLPSFHPIVFAQGFTSTLFFGWLALYLPELFPTHVRATGSGLAYNFGRFATALGVLFASILFTSLGGSYPRIGTLFASIYGLGMIAIWFAPNSPSTIERATNRPSKW